MATPIVRPENVANRSEEKRHVAEQVQRRAAAQRDRGYSTERLTKVVEGRLDAESEQNDAGNHGQVQVAEGVSFGIP
jgi:hypothetical protein